MGSHGREGAWGKKRTDQALSVLKAHTWRPSEAKM